jgi:hypothetical protein
MHRFSSLRKAVYLLSLIYSLNSLPSLYAENLRSSAHFQLDGVKIGLAGSLNFGSKVHTSQAGDLAQVAWYSALRAVPGSRAAAI